MLAVTISNIPKHVKARKVLISMTNRECADKVGRVVNKTRILCRPQLFDFSLGFMRHTQASHTLAQDDKDSIIFSVIS